MKSLTIFLIFMLILFNFACSNSGSTSTEILDDGSSNQTEELPLSGDLTNYDSLYKPIDEEPAFGMQTIVTMPILMDG